MALSADERSARAHLAAYTRWSRTDDRVAALEPARGGLRARFVREVDPDGVMTDEQRKPMVEAAISAHFHRLSLKGAQARRKAAEARAAEYAVADELAALGVDIADDKSA